ncbi:MAG: DUF4251 domain-containing protein [Bacteroidota bacterium]|nr:DUF4251 domain-containing protein [Bacteroidota bacterium]
MKKIFLIVGLIGITLTVSFAQNKKADKEAAAAAQFEKAVSAIEAKDFVIIVDAYESGSGTIETNSDDANFLSYEKEFVFMQGTIVAGNEYTNRVTVSDYKQTADKKGNIKIEMQCKGSFLTAKVEIRLKKGGNYADVIVTPTSRTISQKKGETGSQSKAEVLTSRGSETALPSVGEAFSSSQKDASSSKSGGVRQFSGEIVPRAESKYFKRPGVV